MPAAKAKKASKAKAPVKASKPAARPPAKGKKAAKTAARSKASKRPATAPKRGKQRSTPTKGKKRPQTAVKRKQTASPRPRKPAPPLRRDVAVKLHWPHDWHCPHPDVVLVVSPDGRKCTVNALPGRYELHAVRTFDGHICDPVQASVVTVIINPPPKEINAPQTPAPIPVSDRAVQSPNRDEFKWYVLACVPGDESKVKGRLNKHLALAGLKSFVKKVLNAKKSEMCHDADGRLYWRTVKAYPGYLLVHMHFTPDVEKIVKKTYGAIGLLMPKPKPAGRIVTDMEKLDMEMWRPEAVESEEMAIVLLEEATKKAAPAPKAPAVDLAEGDRVIVTAGLLQQAHGRVVRIDRTDELSPSVVIETKLLGREVQHTVKYFQCRKA